jgi:hypothetical protein
MADSVIRISPKQLQWLEAILMDQDGPDALEFLKQVVSDQLRSQQPQECGPKVLAARQGT